jgi:hypothetical protein
LLSANSAHPMAAVAAGMPLLRKMRPTTAAIMMESMAAVSAPAGAHVMPAKAFRFTSVAAETHPRWIERG